MKPGPDAARGATACKLGVRCVCVSVLSRVGWVHQLASRHRALPVHAGSGGCGGGTAPALRRRRGAATRPALLLCVCWCSWCCWWHSSTAGGETLRHADRQPLALAGATAAYGGCGSVDHWRRRCCL
jgi:hypothetical protein